MPSPYSYDLRIRVVAAVEQGMEVTEASRIFGLHRDTITGWLARKAATGDVQAKVGYQRGHSHKITDPDQFKTGLTLSMVSRPRSEGYATRPASKS